MNDQDRNAIIHDLRRDVADLKSRVNVMQESQKSDAKEINTELQSISLTIAKMDQKLSSVDKWKDNTTSAFFKWFGGVAVTVTLAILAMIFSGGIDP